METSGFRDDHNHGQSHVPQQSRRHKLRVHQQVLGSTPISHHLDSPLNLDHHQQHYFSFHQDQVNNDNDPNVRHDNLLFDQSHQGMISSSSEIFDFSRNTATRHSSDAPHPSFMVNWNRNSLNPNNVEPQGFESWPVATTSLFLNHSLPHGNSDMIEGDQVVTVASTSGNELVLLPFSFASQDHRNPHHHHHSLASPSVVDDNSNNNNSNLQGLSLSLSSIYPQQGSATAALPNMAAHRIIDNHHHHQGSSDSDQDMPKSAAKCRLVPKPSIISKPCGKSLQDIVGVSSGGAYRVNSGPLGPFTGYATILRNSRFLKPAQQLMEEFCGPKVAATAISKGIDPVNSESDTHDHDHRHYHHRQDLMGNVNSGNNGIGCASSSTFYGSNDVNGGDQEDGRVGSNLLLESGSSSSQPEHVQQKKAKLLHMQEEVSRRYKQYRQQMQMVMSSFESVSGLSSATPYISLALKSVSRHFRGLKNTIADQLNHTRRVLGEDIVSPTTSAKDTIRLKYNAEQGPQKSHRSSGANLAFHEPQQHHIWRPQRGLPERAVAVLRAWLFEHFLHPYPTDTDKHMLATQTGLTRNQVSNWFINARVRVWKPMVEEIHTLETKGMSTSQLENNNNHRNDLSSNDHQAAMSAKELDCAGASTLSALGHNGRASMLLGADQHAAHGQEKRSTLEFSTTAHEASLSLAGSVVQGFVPYHRNGLEVWSRAEQ